MTADVVSKPVSASHSYTPRATDIAMTAMSLIGTPYRYGGNSPLTGLDCSGFVKYVYKETLNTNLPRTAAEMSRVGQPVSRDELKPGDLVFYNTMRRSNSHVGIYLGDGRFIHSPRTGQRVRINSMDESYWRGRFNGARRIIGGEGVDRAKVLQQYSREADTSPDTYNYDESDDPGEPPRERPVRNHRSEQKLTDTQVPSSDVAVQETVSREIAVSRDREEVRHERRHSRRRTARHQQDAVTDASNDNYASRRHRGTRHHRSSQQEEVHHKDSRHSHSSREKVRDSHRQESRVDRSQAGKTKTEKTSDRKKADKAKAIKSIERKTSAKEKSRRKR